MADVEIKKLSNGCFAITIDGFEFTTHSMKMIAVNNADRLRGKSYQELLWHVQGYFHYTLEFMQNTAVHKLVNHLQKKVAALN